MQKRGDAEILDFVTAGQLNLNIIIADAIN